MTTAEDIITRLRKRAAIRRVAKGRKSVELGQPDRIADLLEEAAELLAMCADVLEDARETCDAEGDRQTRDQCDAAIRKVRGQP